MAPPRSDHRYDPDAGPEPSAWLELDRGERIDAVRAWRRREGVEVSNERMFAAMLATAETQVARGDEMPVAATLRRLMDQGMTRREAIHAITTILAETTYDAFYGETSPSDPNAAYFTELEHLTPESWRTRFDDDVTFPVF
jgi:hypothetical protein